MVGSVVLRTAYGYEVKAENDYYINLVHKAILPLMEVVHAGIYIVEYLPMLKHVPGKYFTYLWASPHLFLTDSQPGFRGPVSRGRPQHHTRTQRMLPKSHSAM
jgi:hypothetical protein